MSYKLEFEINDLPKMANIQGGKSHWRYAHAEVKKWHRLVLFAVNKNKPEKPLSRARLTLTRFSSSAPDYDGLVRGFKSIVDGLRACGVLKDDTLAVTGAWDCRWERAPQKKGKVHINVQETE